MSASIKKQQKYKMQIYELKKREEIERISTHQHSDNTQRQTKIEKKGKREKEKANW